MVFRCDWVTDKLHQKYHDNEWGVPEHRDRKLFEFLLLDGAQAGLSWLTILKKRSAYRTAFDNFNPNKIADYRRSDINALLKNDSIIRNKQKIESFVNNAKKFLEVKDEFGSFDHYIWGFVNYKTIHNTYEQWSDAPTYSKQSEEMSKDLKLRGFTFVGPTICYAYMQTIGMVNDHAENCFRYNFIKNIVHEKNIR